MTDAAIFDSRRCELGEGLLWHPARGQIFWFDIINKRLMSQDAAGAPLEWRFDEHVSAAGWIDHDRLLIASETALFDYSLRTGARAPIVALEAENAVTRSNDGRADPHGGFWIGTMGKRMERGAGAIYRFYRGAVRRLYADITVSNAICFDPKGAWAQFCDTVTGRVMRVALDAEGWPVGEPAVFLDLRAERLNPDGAIIDAEGATWIAQWGAARVAVYGPDGALQRVVATPGAPHSACPCLGGDGLSTLFVATAQENLNAAERARFAQSGMTFALPGAGRGVAEPAVALT